jgi:hypothetical protein
VAFSDQAIGFYLQGENTLSPMLREAGGDYRKFVGDIEKWNKKAYKAATAGLGQLGKLVGAFGGATKKAMEVDVVFSAKSEKSFRKSFGQAMSDVLARTKFRGRATIPEKRFGVFDMSVSLRTLYKQMAQPPDLLGQLMPPRRFAKGGVVEGDPGVDKVLSLLTKGELVVPAEATKKLLEMAEGPLKGKGGKFVGAKEIGQLFSEVTNLGGALVKMKGGLEAGLGTKEDFQNYEAGLTALAKKTKDLEALTTQLSFATRLRLEPALGAAQLQLKEFTEQGDEAQGTFEKLLRKILTPARFLALSTALDKTTESFRNILHSGQDAFGSLEEGRTESFVTNMNQTNRVLQLTREELRDFKRDAATVSRGAETDLNAISESIEGMAQAGMRDRDAMLELAPTVARMATATNAGVDTLSKAAFRLSDNFGFSRDQVAGVFDDIRMFAKAEGADAGKMIDDLTGQMELLGPALSRATTEEGRSMLSNLGRLGASLASVWAGETDTITGMISHALAGEPDAISSLGMVFGESVEGMTERLKSGNLEGLLDGLAAQINSMEGNAQGLQVLKDVLKFEGTTTQFQNLGKEIGTVNTNLVDLGKQQHSITDMATATDALQEASTQQLTLFGRLSRSLSNLSGVAIPGTEFVLGDLADMFKEVNATTLLSLAYLGPGLLKATATGVKGVGKLAGGLFGMLGKLTGLGGLFGGKGKGGGVGSLVETVAGAGGKAAGAAGTGGFLAGLGGGLTALAGGLTTFGTAMLGPGGLGFLALVAGLLAGAAAVRIAMPLFEVIGEVLMHAVDGLVQMFEAATQADPKNLLALGPGLIGGAAGVVAMAGALTLYGAALAIVAPGLLAVRAATGMTGGFEGGAVVGVIEALIGELGPLQGKERELQGVNRALELVCSFLGRFAVIGAEIAALGAGALIGQTVTSVLGFFGVKSPMQALAEGSGVMVDTIAVMVTNFERLAEFGEGRLATIATVMRDMVGFMGDYALLAEQLESMPGTGAFASIGDSILGFFGADSPAEKIAAQAGPIAESMRALLSNFEKVGGLRQNGPATGVSEDQLQAVIDATMSRDADERLHTDLQEQTAVLREMLAVLMEGKEQTEAKPSTRPMRGPSKGNNDMANGIAGFAF